LSYIEAWVVIQFDEGPRRFFETEAGFDAYCRAAQADFNEDGIPTEVHRVKHGHPAAKYCTCEQAAGGSLFLAFKEEDRRN
jgi:hypothetical protein